tara:strand:- start:1007 stop:1306 length:300 start_codon:yes stop_codon:yes gene_type:complete
MWMKVIEKYHLDEEKIDRIIAMAWEDRTPFEAIEFQFGLSEKEVIQLMKFQLKLSNWKKWRSRVKGRATKHQKLKNNTIGRFKSNAQRQISGNRISKRK